jgi:LuxR family quorum sensing-dependent transcriptional regulator
MFMNRFRTEALAALARLADEKTVDGVVNILATALAPFGAECFCFNYAPRFRQGLERLTLAYRIPAECLRLYLKKDLASLDPAFRRCQWPVELVELSAPPCTRQSDAETAELVLEAADRRHPRGLLVPIAGPAGCIGTVWIGGAALDFPTIKKPFIRLLAVYAFERVRQISSTPVQKTSTLTPREREILTWIAAGKTAWEVGEILKIAKRTVEEHCQAAMQKLGAMNRTQAVALAVRDRLITV